VILPDPSTAGPLRFIDPLAIHDQLIAVAIAVHSDGIGKHKLVIGATDAKRAIMRNLWRFDCPAE
jgi:hypothetical protein